MKLPVLLLFFLSPSLAHAYLDPGTGSLLLQSLIGAIALGFGAISLYWGQLKAKFKGKRKEEQKKEVD